MLNGHRIASRELNTVCLMREMKWTYEECLGQPAWVLNTLAMMIDEENTKSKADSKKRK